MSHNIFSGLDADPHSLSSTGIKKHLSTILPKQPLRVVYCIVI